jgi:hypothetical protein
MGAKALGMVLAVFQVFAGGTKLFCHKEKNSKIWNNVSKFYCLIFT